jgi:peptide-methionine (S)-S-oxide reductase
MMLLDMHRTALALTLTLATTTLVACQGSETAAKPVASPRPDTEEEPMADKSPDGLELATFGAGCYWCVEAVLEQLDGVSDVRSGFMGGSVANPSYEAVCSGKTGHAEVVHVAFDPETIGYGELLDWFWRLHDPTTLNRQGADVGTQYRSAIFYHSEEQRRAAEASKQAAQRQFRAPIVTEITAAGPFYEAAEYHQDYYRQNKTQGYCRAVIAPKLDKLGLEK